jgi:hypothetical protein
MTFRKSTARLLILCFAALIGFAASSLRAADPVREPTPAEIDAIIHKFAAKESEFARARDNYTYRQTTKLIEIDEAGQQGGKYELVADVVFTDSGKRTERVVRAPVTTLAKIIMTPEDEQDLRNVLPFVLTTRDLDEYTVNYLGRQKVDEIGCYTFAVKPKQLDKSGKRYFEGEIWVDDQDFQIVKTYGRSTGYLKHKGQQFPKFETYREQIDGKYWFPTYTYADDVLNFDTGPQRIKEVIRYDNYKQFKSDVVIKYGDTVSGDQPAAPAPPKPPQPNPPQQ